MIRRTERIANINHRCEKCNRPTFVGERYQELVASPYHDDLGNLKWWRMRVCWEHRWED